MRYFILTLLVFALTVPASAKEIELSLTTGSDFRITSPSIDCLSVVFGGKGETELFWDDGTFDQVVADPDGSDLRLATDYTAPADCHLSKLKFHLPSNPNGTEVGLYAYADGSSAPGSEIGYISHTGLVADWNEVDVTSMGVTFTNGDVFWVGLATSGDADRINSYHTDYPGHSLYFSWSGGSSWNTWTDFGLMVRAIVNDDMDGPVAAAQDPADGDNGVSVDIDILFDIDDADIGVDSGTIVDGSVTVDQDIPTKGKIDVPGLLTFDDTDPNNVHVTFNPISDFEEGAIVTVTVSPAGTKITDDLGNEMAEDSWTFDIIPSGVEAASLGTIKAEFK